MKLTLDCKHGLPKETLFKVVKENTHESYFPNTYDEFLTQLIIDKKLGYNEAVDLSISNLNTQFANIIRGELVSLFGIEDIKVNVSGSSTTFKVSVDVSYEQPNPKFIADVAYKILKATVPDKLESVLSSMTYDQMIAGTVKYYKCSYKEAKQLVDIIMLDHVVLGIIEGCLHRILHNITDPRLRVYVVLANTDELIKLRRKYENLLRKLTANLFKDQGQVQS
jgi:hypothetical protein